MKNRMFKAVTMGLLSVSSLAYAARANWVEYGYFDEHDGLVGSITYGCQGRPTIEGEVTTDIRFVSGGRCLGGGLP